MIVAELNPIHIRDETSRHESQPVSLTVFVYDFHVQNWIEHVFRSTMMQSLSTKVHPPPPMHTQRRE